MALPKDSMHILHTSYSKLSCNRVPVVLFHSRVVVMPMAPQSPGAVRLHYPAMGPRTTCTSMVQ